MNKEESTDLWAAAKFIDEFDGSQLSEHWRKPTSINVANGIVRFAPEPLTQLITVREDFSDIVLSVDVRIVRHVAGIIVRWNSPSEYYMVQVGPPNDEESDKVAWFHVFSPKHGSWHRDDLAQGRSAAENKWYRFRLQAVGYELTLCLNELEEDGSIGATLIEELAWKDPDKLFNKGAIGFWECPGEQGEFRNLSVTPYVKS